MQLHKGYVKMSLILQLFMQETDDLIAKIKETLQFRCQRKENKTAPFPHTKYKNTASCWGDLDAPVLKKRNQPNQRSHRRKKAGARADASKDEHQISLADLR
jgi:hypothetical protein